VQQQALAPVERFFQLALLGLVASGYLAIAGSGYVDAPTVVLAGIGLIWRAAIILGARRLQVPDRVVTIATLVYMVFAPIDYFFLAKTWITATVHVVFFVASVKTLTARTSRDYLFVSAVAFIELLAAALFSSSGTFFVCLAAYLLCGVAARAASEVYRSADGETVVAPLGAARAPMRIAMISGLMTCGILLLTGGLFFILPRTANAALHLLGSNRYHLTGFSNDVTLGDGNPPALPLNLKWRGLALEQFDGHRWSTKPGGFHPMEDHESGLIRVADEWQRRRRGPRAVYRVELQNVDADALFAAGIPEYLNIGSAHVSRAPSGAFRFGFVPTDTLRYEVYSFIGPDSGAQEQHRFQLTEEEREENLQVPPLDPRIAELARQMTRGASDNFEKARMIEKRLRHDYTYTLDLPSTDVRDPIALFLFDRKKGHCEYFASAMAVILRDLQIPARLVNGFQSGIANPYSGTLVIRASDAHAWVEAFFPETGWTVFDPTPGGAAPPQTVWTTLSLYLDAADTFWHDWVLSYDLGRQISLASRLESDARDFRTTGWMLNPQRLARVAESAGEWIYERGRGLAGLVAGILLGVLGFRQLRQWRPRRAARQGRSVPSDATLFYTRMLALMKRRGFQKPAWFTPQEFANSVPTEAGADLEQFTAAYYAVRFGGNPEASRKMVESLEKLAHG
jgi:transglutaminase-like putative cysteine protease